MTVTKDASSLRTRKTAAESFPRNQCHQHRHSLIDTTYRYSSYELNEMTWFLLSVGPCSRDVTRVILLRGCWLAERVPLDFISPAWLRSCDWSLARTRMKKGSGLVKIYVMSSLNMMNGGMMGKARVTNQRSDTNDLTHGCYSRYRSRFIFYHVVSD